MLEFQTTSESAYPIRSPLHGARLRRKTALDVVVAINAAFVLFYWIFRDRLGSLPAVGVAVGINDAQIAMLAIWTALGSGRWIVRIVVSLAAMFALMCVWNSETIGDYCFALAYAITLWLALAGPLVIARMLRKERIAYGSDSNAPSKPGEHQLNLKQLLLATAIAGMMFALGRAADRQFHFMQNLEGSLGINSLLVTFGVVIAAPAAWGLLGQHRPKRSLLAYCSYAIAVMVFAFLMTYSIHATKYFAPVIACVQATQSLWLVVSLLLLRLAGFRLVRDKERLAALG